MRLRDDLVLRQVGKDFLIVDPAQDRVDMTTVFTLNESAAWLWRALEGRDFSEQTLTDLLRHHYDVSEDQAEKDVQSLLETFQENGLLKK